MYQSGYELQQARYNQMVENEKKVLREIIDKRKKSYLCAIEEVSDAEALGNIMSRFFEWTGEEIFRAMLYGLEDSNCHTLLRKLMDFITEDGTFGTEFSCNV